VSFAIPWGGQLRSVRTWPDASTEMRTWMIELSTAVGDGGDRQSSHPSIARLATPMANVRWRALTILPGR